MVPAEGGPKILKLKSSWHRRLRSKMWAVSLKQWKGRRGGGSRGGGYPPPSACGVRPFWYTPDAELLSKTLGAAPLKYTNEVDLNHRSAAPFLTGLHVERGVWGLGQSPPPPPLHPAWVRVWAARTLGPPRGHPGEEAATVRRNTSARQRNWVSLGTSPRTMHQSPVPAPAAPGTQ